MTLRARAERAPASDARRRLLVVSHSYLLPENRKTPRALREYLDVRVLTPRRLPVSRDLRKRFFGAITMDGDVRTDELLLARHAVYMPFSRSVTQYGLVSVSLGMREHRPDVIHVELPPWSLLFWQVVVARRCFAPTARLTVLVKKNTYRRYPGRVGWVKDRLARAGLSRVDLVLAASRMSVEMLKRELGVPDDHVVLARQIGVDGVAFSPRCPDAGSRESVTVGYSGRLEPEKGVGTLVAAVERCRSATGVDVRLALLGGGTMDESLRMMATSASWLELLGPVPGSRVPDFLRGLDIFVLPAHRLPDHEEHDAQSLVEALATGVATIGTASGIIPDLLGDGTGLLVLPGETQALADALATLVVDAAARERLARRGRLKAEASLTVEAVARQYADLYGNLCA